MNTITVKNTIKSDIEKAWQYWTDPNHIVNWNFATNEWHCPAAINDLNPGGKFSWRMEAKDGSMAFDYSGVYESVEKHKKIRKRLDDGRLVHISFSEIDGKTELVETFEPDQNDPELQRQGWQAILDNFKNYVESN
jgi:uncharacterized protein YndB with AHSA1/START domain